MKTILLKYEKSLQILLRKSIKLNVRKRVATVVFTTICSSLFAFTNHTRIYSDWILEKTVNHVDFYYKITECSGSQAVFLKFENKNKFDVKISWKEIFSTQMENKKEGYQGTKELTLSKGVIMPAGCSDFVNKKNIVLATEIDPTYVAEIRKFEFKDVSVTEVKK